MIERVRARLRHCGGCLFEWFELGLPLLKVLSLPSTVYYFLHFIPPQKCQNHQAPALQRLLHPSPTMLCLHRLQLHLNDRLVLPLIPISQDWAWMPKVMPKLKLQALLDKRMPERYVEYLGSGYKVYS